MKRSLFALVLSAALLFASPSISVEDPSEPPLKVCHTVDMILDFMQEQNPAAPVYVFYEDDRYLVLKSKLFDSYYIARMKEGCFESGFTLRHAFWPLWYDKHIVRKVP